MSETTTNPPSIGPGTTTPPAPAQAPAPPAAPDPAQPQQQPAPQPQEQAGNLFAGKYQSPDQLEQGYQSLREKLGLPKVEGQLYGKDGIFADVSKLEQGYKDMEALVGRQQPAQPQQQPGQQPPGDTSKDGPLSVKPGEQAPPADEGVEAVLTKAGLDNDAVMQQFAQEGKLTDEQYAALQKANPLATRKIVDQVLGATATAAQAAQLQQQQIQQEATQLVGGQQQLQNLFGWAANNIPKEELGNPDNPEPGTINQRLANPSLYKSAINELMARQRQAIGAGGSTGLAQGGTPAAATGVAAKTLEEFRQLSQQAMAGDAQAKARIMATDPDKFI